jgi:hypothetical protein
LFNLVNDGLIRFDKASHRYAVAASATTNKIDWKIVQTIEHGMRRPDTGLYTYAALLWSLQQEFYRYEGIEMPFSVVIFGYCLKSEPFHPDFAPSFIPFRAKAVAELREKVSRTKRKYDLLCHHGAFGYALVLPMTARDTARRVVEILAETCSSIEITDEYHKNQIEFRAGMANIPEDCVTLEEMMAISLRARALGG